MSKFLPKKMLPTSRRQRPPPVAESESALDRTNHVSLHSRRSRIRAYSKYDYPANDDPLGDTGHGTQGSSASPIPSEITIKLDDLHDGAFPGSGGSGSSPWVFRRAPPPAVDNCPQRPRGTSSRPRIEGQEDQDADDEEQATYAEIRHDNTNIEQSNKEHNDNSTAMAENTATGSSSAQNPKPESSRSAAPPSYDECVQLGLFEKKERRTTTAVTATTTESDTGTSSNNIRTETTTTTTTTTTSDALATGMPRGVYASESAPNGMEPISSSGSAAQTNSTPFPSTNDDLLSYGFQDEDDEEDADVLRARVDKRQQRGFARRSTTTTITTTTTAAAATRSIQSAPPPSTGPAPTRLVHQDSLLSTSRSMASEESVREEMGRILAALHAQQQQGEVEEQGQGQQQKATNSSSSRSSPPSSSSSSSPPPNPAKKRPVYLDVPMGTSLYPQLGHPVPVPPRQGSE